MHCIAYMNDADADADAESCNSYSDASTTSSLYHISYMKIFQYANIMPNY